MRDMYERKGTTCASLYACRQPSLANTHACQQDSLVKGGWRSGDYLELVRDTMAHQGAHIDGGGPERRMWRHGARPKTSARAARPAHWAARPVAQAAVMRTCSRQAILCGALCAGIVRAAAGAGALRGRWGRLHGFRRVRIYCGWRLRCEWLLGALLRRLSIAILLGRIHLQGWGCCGSEGAQSFVSCADMASQAAILRT